MSRTDNDFTCNGASIGVTMEDYFKWSYVDLSDKVFRSSLAEFIVSSSLGYVRHYPTILFNGYRVKVASASYLESFDGDQPDCICFENDMHSDVTVFCVCKAMSRNASPTDIDLWDFFVLRTSYLNNKQTITLPFLMSLQPYKCNYYGIQSAIDISMNC